MGYNTVFVINKYVSFACVHFSMMWGIIINFSFFTLLNYLLFPTVHYSLFTLLKTLLQYQKFIIIFVSNIYVFIWKVSSEGGTLITI